LAKHKRVYKNPNAGKKCGGICDKCEKESVFLVHGLAYFCDLHKTKMDWAINAKRKYALKVPNFMMQKSCVFCMRRDTTIWQVNFSFCKKCIQKMGKFDHQNANEIARKDKFYMDKFKKKTDFREMSEEEVEKARRERRKKII